MTPVITPAIFEVAREFSGAAFGARSRLVDDQGAALEVLTVALLNGLVGLLLRAHLHESKSTGFVRELIEHLPQEQKEVLFMRHYSDMSFKDIAEQTDVSINTALGRMRYALINLRKLIQEKDIVLTR